MWEKFDALYAAYNSMVYWTAYGVTHNHNTSAEVTQTVFLRAWEHWKLVERLSSPQAKCWLYRAARNASVDWIRRERQEPSVDSRAEPVPASQNPLWEQLETAQWVRQAVEELPQLYREAIILHYFAGLTQRQAVRVLCITGNTYRSRLFRGRQLLQRRLEE